MFCKCGHTGIVRIEGVVKLISSVRMEKKGLNIREVSIDLESINPNQISLYCPNCGKLEISAILLECPECYKLNYIVDDKGNLNYTFVESREIPICNICKQKHYPDETSSDSVMDALSKVIFKL